MHLGGGGVGGGIYADFNCTWTRCHMNDQKLTDTYTSSINLNCDANRRHQKSSIKHQTMWRSPVKFTWCTQILSTTTVIQTMLMLGGSSRAILDNYNVRRDGEFQKRWRIPEETASPFLLLCAHHLIATSPVSPAHQLCAGFKIPPKWLKEVISTQDICILETNKEVKLDAYLLCHLIGSCVG